MTILYTERLRMEPYSLDHFDGLLAMNSDLSVMKYITGKSETPEGVKKNIQLVRDRWAKFGFSWWSFIEKSSGELVGAGCVQYFGQDENNPLELGWRLRPDAWGKGLATEAARRLAKFAFEEQKAPLVVAVCMPENAASKKVMGRLGMSYRGQETHNGTLLSVYELKKDDWDRLNEMA